MKAAARYLITLISSAANIDQPDVRVFADS
jgi:hypothetical protein